MEVRLYSGDSELPAFRIGDKLMVSNPDPAVGEALAETVARILRDETLTGRQAAERIAGAITEASFRGTLVGRTDSEVTLSDLRSGESEAVEPSTQTFAMKEIVACLQRRKEDDAK